MTADERELMIQLAVGTIVAVVVAVIALRATSRPPLSNAALRLAFPSVVSVAIVSLGILEARLLAAIAAGAATGVLIAGIRRRESTRLPRLAASTAVAILPLVAMPLPIAGVSVFDLTHDAAATSGGNWLTAWRHSWELSVAGDTTALTIAWMLLLAAAFAAVALAWAELTAPATRRVRHAHIPLAE